MLLCVVCGVPFAQMSDAKVSPHSTNAAALQLWTDRLWPAIGTALLDDLIRLIGEYCLSRLSWSPTHRSKRIAIIDADADGLGRVLQFLREPAAGEIDAPSPYAWYAALSVAPLSELAGGSSVFSWGVRVDDWTSSSLTVGVAFADAKCIPVGFGVCDRAYGAFFAGEGLPSIPVHRGSRTADTDGWESLSGPQFAANSVQMIRLTADLSADTVSVAVERVPKAKAGEEAHSEPVAPLTRIADPSWSFAVPDLSHCHLHAAGAGTMRLTLMP